MPSLVLTPRLTNDSLCLGRAAAELGWTVHRATRYQLPDTLEDPAVHGEMVFCDVVAERLQLGLLEPSAGWLAELPWQYRERSVRLLRHGDLPAITERSFIKPANDKLFEAGIFETGAHVPHRHIDPDLPVLVSDVVSFAFELRCYVLDREVRTAGVYAMWGGAAEHKEREMYEAGSEWLCELLADDDVWLPSAIVIDIGFMPELRRWAVVEANQAYASGIYTGGFLSDRASPGADPREVLRVIERAAGPRSKVKAADERWLRPLGRRP